VDCPRCQAPLQEATFDGHLQRPVTIDLCHPCQSIWFDARESISLTPGSTLALFRMIGEKLARPPVARGDLAKCPRCKARLRTTHDMQRTTRFQYLSCPNGHGRLTTFFDFLREKDFIRPLTPQQIEELRRTIDSVNCSNCGAPVDLSAGAPCSHCGSPLSMLDLKQAGRLVEQLRGADERSREGVDPALPLELARARREVDLAFASLDAGPRWVEDVSATGLVGAGLSALARWLKGNP
jgi:Transcription factor zinc-finger